MAGEKRLMCKGGNEGLALAGVLHLGDLALVEDGSANKLDIEMAHANSAAAGLTHDGEGLGDDRVQCGPVAARTPSSGRGLGYVLDCGGDAGAELSGLVAELHCR